MLRMSKLFLRTLREDPADAEVPSHRLLVRAGYVRRVAPGIFTWLPLGFLTYRKVEEIVREGMNAAGFQEVHFPALLPREPFEQTGRWTEYGESLFRLQDRRSNDYLLGPTHEEMFTLTVKQEVSSYKDLPLSLYQIQTKYRDEARPRAGILRGREFVMKDSYSFDVDDAGMEASYQAHKAAYIKVFDRLGLEYVIVSAVSGAMGGSVSEEFLAPCDSGEDTFVQCPSCDYAANIEAADTAIPRALETAERPEMVEVATPGTETINSLVDFANSQQTLASPGERWTAADTLKNVVLMVTDSAGERTPLVVGLPGDREVDMKRLEAGLAPALVAPFTEADFASHPMLVRGYIGPQILGSESETGIRYLTDARISADTSWVTGANHEGHHVFGAVAGRDFQTDGTIEAAAVHVGDPCPRCAAGLQIRRGIEIGHIFQLGRKYAEVLGLQVLDQNGKLVTVTMGSYGIGVSRAVAAVAEQTHDEHGLCWPASIAPADCHIMVMGKKAEILAEAERLAGIAESRGISVLLDDRTSASAGVKFNDAELIGIPTIVIAGRGLADGVVEVKDRRSGVKSTVPVDDLVDELLQRRAVMIGSG
jgi:prolyl-tRNA synthetase